MTDSAGPAFRTLRSGLVLVESPRWDGDRLLFADWGAGEIWSVDAAGEGAVWARVDGLPFCLDRLAADRLLVTCGGQLLELSETGDRRVYAELADVARTPWNEVTVSPQGFVYVNNIGYDFPGGQPGPGFVALVGADGSARTVAGDLAFPNGMAVTPDGTTLIVAESHSGQLTAFEITADGSLVRRRTWAAVPGSAPDGICLDAAGAVWYADVPGRHCVRVAEGGEVLQTLSSDLGCFSCALGGPDGHTLFVTAAAWPGAMTPGSRTGAVLAARVDVPAAVHAGPR